MRYFTFLLMCVCFSNFAHGYTYTAGLGATNPENCTIASADCNKLTFGKTGASQCKQIYSNLVWTNYVEVCEPGYHKAAYIDIKGCQKVPTACYKDNVSQSTQSKTTSNGNKTAGTKTCPKYDIGSSQAGGNVEKVWIDDKSVSTCGYAQTECTAYGARTKGDAKNYYTCKNGKWVLTKASNKTCPDKYKDGYVPCWANQKEMGATQCYRKCHSDHNGATTLIVKCNDQTKPAEKNAGWTTAKGEALYAKCVAKQPPKQQQQPPKQQQQPPKKQNPQQPNPEPVQPNPTTTHTCTAEYLAQLIVLRQNCPDSAEVQALIKTIENYCNSETVTEDQLEKYMKTLESLHAQQCNQTPQKSEEEQLCNQISDAHIVNGKCTCDDSSKILDRDEMVCKEDTGRIISESRERIATIASKINSLKSGLGTSVWKDKEGNFNTSRLVSDSVAGVVLGTAGGLITSSIVKKNQVKSGFGDISCTVRGQVVSGYGDEFQVGIQ